MERPRAEYQHSRWAAVPKPGAERIPRISHAVSGLARMRAIFVKRHKFRVAITTRRALQFGVYDRADPPEVSRQNVRAQVDGALAGSGRRIFRADQRCWVQHCANEPYWNHGCAHPEAKRRFPDRRHLDRSGPWDALRARSITGFGRSANIQKLREGNDPSTNYQQDGRGGISDVGD